MKLAIAQPTSILSKAIFAVGVVAIAGIIGVVRFAQADTNANASGYGTSGAQAIADANTLEASLVTSSQNFSSDTESCESQSQTILLSGAGDNYSSFNTAYDQATAAYAASLNSAFNTFRTQVSSAASTAVSKDQFIDAFNHAKADYQNQLDAAKNTFANALSPLGDNANQAKDKFVGCYNTSRDGFSNSLEVAKNQFAANLG